MFLCPKSILKFNITLHPFVMSYDLICMFSSFVPCGDSSKLITKRLNRRNGQNNICNLTKSCSFWSNFSANRQIFHKNGLNLYE